MNTGSPANGPKRRGQVSIQEWFKSARPSFSEEDLVTALKEMVRRDTGVTLPAPDQEFWDKHAGVSASRQDVARASATNAAAEMLMDSSAYTATEVALF